MVDDTPPNRNPARDAIAELVLPTAFETFLDSIENTEPDSVTNSQRALVLAPHPDDFDAIAVTIDVLKERGWTLFLSVLTSGANGVQDEYPGAGTIEKKTKIREQEQLLSCKQFGLDPASTHSGSTSPHAIVFHRLASNAEGKLDTGLTNQSEVTSRLLDVKPDLVFMPHGNDSNSTHQRCFKLFEQALGEINVENPLELPVALLNRDEKTIDLRDEIISEFDENRAQWKRQLLRLHDSQQQRNLALRGIGFDDRVLGMNRATAGKLDLNADYAESFELLNPTLHK